MLAQVCSVLCIGLIIQEYLWFVDLALGHLEVWLGRQKVCLPCRRPLGLNSQCRKKKRKKKRWGGWEEEMKKGKKSIKLTKKKYPFHIKLLLCDTLYCVKDMEWHLVFPFQDSFLCAQSSFSPGGQSWLGPADILPFSPVPRNHFTSCQGRKDVSRWLWLKSPHPCNCSGWRAGKGGGGEMAGDSF